MEQSTYDYWEKALADPKALHRREFRITAEPQPGFYRTKGGEPVAIWWDEDRGGIEMYIGHPYRPVSDYEAVWLSCAQRPVTEAEYRKVADDGATWSDLDETVASLKGDQRNDPEGAIDDLAAKAEQYKEIADDETAQRALSLRAALLEQHKRADGIREEAKKPHLKAAREVDEQWMPMTKKAKKWADYLRVMVEAWETRKRRLAREAEAAAIKSADIIPAPEPSDQIRTGYGRAVSVGTRQIVTGIKDIDEVLRWYRGDARLAVALIAMAQDDLKDGHPPAGVTVEEVAVVR